MASPRPHRLRRRVLLSAPALVIAAATVAARPGVAQAATPPECVADLIVADRLRGS